MKLMFAILIGSLALACSSAPPPVSQTPMFVLPNAAPTATHVHTVNSTETTAGVGLPLRLEDRDSLYRIHRDALDQVFAEFDRPTAKDTEISSVCRLLGESGWDVIELLVVHPSVNLRLTMMSSGLDGSIRAVDRMFRKNKPSTWPGYSLADFCADFQRVG